MRRIGRCSCLLACSKILRHTRLLCYENAPPSNYRKMCVNAAVDICKGNATFPPRLKICAAKNLTIEGINNCKTSADER